MVGDDQDVDIVSDLALVESAQELTDPAIDALDRQARLFSPGTESMACAVDIREVEGQHSGTFSDRQVEPVEHSADPLVTWNCVVEDLPVARAEPCDLRFRAWPEVGSRANALAFGRDPDRFALPPSAVFDGAAKAQSEVAESLVAHVVCHDAVLVGIEPGDDRVVVGEGLGRKDRNQTVSLDAFAGETLDVGGVVEIQIVPAKAIDADQDHGRQVLLGGARGWRGGDTLAAEVDQRTDQQEQEPERHGRSAAACWRRELSRHREVVHVAHHSVLRPLGDATKFFRRRCYCLARPLNPPPLALERPMSPLVDALIPDFVRYAVRRRRHRGSACYCSVCNSRLAAFRAAGEPKRPNAECPVCDAMERHRMIALMLDDLLSQRGGKRWVHALHVAPHLELGRFLAHRCRRVVAGSLAPRRGEQTIDVTDLGFPDDAFDLVLCSHVLEHVPDDKSALAELHRVLAPNGMALLLVPIGAEVTFEDPTVVSEADRLKVFGQADHVRLCGNDYLERIAEAGFDVRRVDAVEIFRQPRMKSHGGLGSDCLFFCRKLR